MYYTRGKCGMCQTVSHVPLNFLLQSCVGSTTKNRWFWEIQKTWNPAWRLKSTVCSCFSLGGTSLSHCSMSESKLLERVLRRSWLWCWLFSYRLPSNGMERKTVSPAHVLWIASIPPPSCLPRVLRFFSQSRGEVWHWGCLPGRSQGEAGERLWALWLMDQTSQSS